jgi:signal peptide peptidase SppA
MGDNVRGNDEDVIERLLVIETVGKIWGIRPEMLVPLSDIHGHVISQGTVTKLTEARSARGGNRNGGPETVATIPLKGMLTPSPSFFSLIFGGDEGGLLGFRSSLRQAVADPKVQAIALDVDSPGGYVDLIPEIAAEIRAARTQKPVVAVSNTMMGSAAYWLGSQASEIVVSPSAEVGSIGVYQIHMDQSKALAMRGIATTIVKAGKYKIEANPYNPLDSTAQDAIQSDVNEYYDMFTADVAKGRGVSQENVKAGYGEGRMLMAKKSVKAGLADRVDTLEATVKRLTHPGALAALRKADAVALADEELPELPNVGKDEDFVPEAQETGRAAKTVRSAQDIDRMLETLAWLR